MHYGKINIATGRSLWAFLLCFAVVFAGHPAAAAVDDTATDDTATDDTATDNTAGGGSADEVLAAIASAWRAGDHVALARLAGADGVLLALVPESNANHECSSGQAHYYFKNVFRNVETLAFDVLAIGAKRADSALDDDDGHELSAVATWRYVRGGVERVDHLFLKLARGPAGWRWTEIRARP